jgi:tetratricopeptide (TPR) repeat protein
MTTLSSEKFCSECGAMLIPRAENTNPQQYCGSCGKAQYSVPALQSQHLHSTVENQGLGKDAMQHRRMYIQSTVAVLLVVVIGTASFATTRYFVKPPIPKPSGAEQQSTAANSQANPSDANQQPVLSPELQQALTVYQDSLVTQPNNPNIILKLANAWYDAGFTYQNREAVFLARQAFAKSEKLYERFLKEFDAKNTAARIDYAYTLLAQGRTDDAIRETQKALEFEPHHPIALYNLGVIYNRKGDLNASKRYFLEAIKADPNSEAAKSAQEILKSLDQQNQQQ